MKRLLAVVILVGCGSRSGGGAPAHPVATDGGGSAQTGETQVAAAKPGDHGDEQCAKLFAHALSLGIAERPADQKLGDQERATVEADLRKSWLTSCHQMSGREYDCALRASTLAQLEGC